MKLFYALHKKCGEVISTNIPGFMELTVKFEAVSQGGFKKVLGDFKVISVRDIVWALD